MEAGRWRPSRTAHTRPSAKAKAKNDQLEVEEKEELRWLGGKKLNSKFLSVSRK